jgi:hypothetical protein
LTILIGHAQRTFSNCGNAHDLRNEI